jgi:lipopolysaccharide transport system ATP-binding protein
MSDTVIKIENLRKQYRLGTIGGTTLNAELQSWWARKRGKEDPNLKIGQDYSNASETFWALDGVNLEVEKGEALGIIGANGAGKSTLLKILSRVTAPTEGDIWVNGRISSMLEVGTGFHGELTGRENIYMNGAILGMTRKEVDAKIESIIDFSECGQFIDTPVKRYSSGMYVKLAFAVASHLDSEIMVMDEVLAVGDMKFQKKCLGKMGDAASNEGRTVLYVSHNMSTIRNLCTKCIVLNKGHIIFNGDVEEAISVYMDTSDQSLLPYYDFSNFRRCSASYGTKLKINYVEFVDRKTAVYKNTEKILVRVRWHAIDEMDIRFGLSVKFCDGSAVGLAESTDIIKTTSDTDYMTELTFDLSNLVPGIYHTYLEPYYLNDTSSSFTVDETGVMPIEIIEGKGSSYRNWLRQYWSSVRLNDVAIISNQKG